MNTKLSFGSGLLISLLSSASWAQQMPQQTPASFPESPAPVAEPTAPPAALSSTPSPMPTPIVQVATTSAADMVPAPSLTATVVPLPSGVLLQARLQTQMNLLSLVTSTSGFLVGYQFRGFALGMGVGLTRASYSSDHTGSQESSTIDGTIFQLTPTAIIDVWHSADRRTRANVVASIGLGRGSFSYDSETCRTSTAGVRTCTGSQEQTAAVLLIPVQVGFGADHFLSRNLALGVETGFQYALATSIEVNGQDLSRNLSVQAFYGLARFTLLIGD